jgi:exonuclease VII small subunit
LFDVNDLTLEEVNAEFSRTLDKLERLSKLREAMLEQDRRRIQKLMDEYLKSVRKEETKDAVHSAEEQGAPRQGDDSA